LTDPDFTASSEPVESPELPTAELRPRRRGLWLWLLPLAAAVAAGWLVFDALSQRGLPLVVEFQRGHGLKAGDALRYRGIVVGTVQTVQLTPDLNGIEVTLRVQPAAAGLARAGSRFWIVRPQLDLSGAAGLETVIGANYVAVLPGQGERQRRFVGLEQPPLAEVMAPGGLHIVLSTPGRGSLRPGAPVLYRQVNVGVVAAVDLARDASAVEAELYIKPDYVALIRENTRFWKTGGARISAGLGGFSINLDSVQSLLLGGVTLAVPPNPGAAVKPGQRFVLADEPEPAWLRWAPSLALDGDNAASVRDRLNLLPVAARWRYKNIVWLTRDGFRQGWAVPLPAGVLGPADVLLPPENALPGSFRLTLAEQPLDPIPTGRQYGTDLAVLFYAHEAAVDIPMRVAAQPENVLIVAGDEAPVRFIGAERIRVEDERWLVDSAVSFDARWHGAAVVAERDGALLGLLLTGGDEAVIARLGEWPP